MGETIELPLDAITLDVDLQPRVKIDKRLVEDYVYAIAEGDTMPPVTVVRNGEKNWLADGYHRFHAFDTLRLPTIPADVRDGNVLDAVMISLRANAEHGKRRQAGDYRKAYDIARTSTWSRRPTATRWRLSCAVPSGGPGASQRRRARRNGWPRPKWSGAAARKARAARDRGRPARQGKVRHRNRAKTDSAELAQQQRNG